MRYGFVLPGGEERSLVARAQEIEAAGWDGVFLAETVYGTDPWVLLGAMAASTARVRLGTLLTPASRRRPWKLASEVATLDRLSGGRAVLVVGLGALDTGFASVGEATDRRTRAELLDECLSLLERFWEGQPFTFAGKHYTVRWDATWQLAPLQAPRVPIWVVGAWPHARSLARALRYDGLLPSRQAADGSYPPLSPHELTAIRAYVAERRTGPYEIVVEGISPLGAPQQAAEHVRPLAEAGATWWIESLWDAPGGEATIRARIAQGPPRGER